MNFWNSLFGLSLLIGCGEKAEEEASEDQRLAEDLWADIGDYSSWDQPASWEGLQPSESTHGLSVSIWLNEVASQALTNEEAIPTGGIIVKEGFNDAEGTNLKSITVMKKVDGYNSNAGDWFWAAYGGDGTVNVSGADDFCISCHAGGDDYVMFTGLQ
jgi:hypothetical protein